MYYTIDNQFEGYRILFACSPAVEYLKQLMVISNELIKQGAEVRWFMEKSASALNLTEDCSSV
ncbi:MAG: hypothetical protein EOO20_29185 [Chryseobacterium sp.]|nr:MAG: hypothetical protein EOO20_29185 [Chryseobacterium sp.]